MTRTEATEKASEYVIEHARYSPDSLNKPYSVRYPEYGRKFFCAADTHELVEKLADYFMAVKETNP